MEIIYKNPIRLIEPELTLDEQLTLGRLEYYTKTNLERLLEVDQPIWKYVLRVRVILEEMLAGRALWDLKEEYLSSVLDQKTYAQTEQSINDAMTLFMYRDEISMDALGFKMEQELAYA